nr:TPA_inf: conotoxin precursor D [Conus judaeus]
MTATMPKLEVMLLVVLILPLPHFSAGGQAMQGNGHRMDQSFRRSVRMSQQRRSWGTNCDTVICGMKCCSSRSCTCKGNECDCS